MGASLSTHPLLHSQSEPPLFVKPAEQAFSRSPQGLFVSAKRSHPKGGGQGAHGERLAVHADAHRCPAIAARRSTASAAFVVARKRLKSSI